jgi:hypothetical protein
MFLLMMKYGKIQKGVFLMESSREDILAEINMLRALVFKLWEEAHGSIEKQSWEEMKKEVINEMRNIEK